MNRLLLILFFISNYAMAQVDLTLGLKAYYPFNGNANDVSGNNNNPSFNNAVLAADRFGNANSAYQFNGVNNYMRIPNSPSLNTTNQITLCAWVKVSGFYQGTCHDNSIIMKGDDDYLTGNYHVRFSDNIYTNHQQCLIPLPDENHETFFGINTTTPVPNSNPYVQRDRWYSIVWTSDGNTSRLYVNCELNIQGPSNNLTFTNAYDLFLGKMNHPQYPYWFNGIMDEVRIYNRVLNQQEINAVGGCLTTSCNNWLNLPSYQSYVGVGDLDVPGNQITVEANFNRTTAYSNGYNWAGDLVSKHIDPIDVNYLLRPNNAEITTTNGYFTTPPVCEIQLNKTYHAAMVYDGATLKFYRNGFLLSSVPATGNMFQNDHQTRIGLYDALVWNTNLIGFINEVRIWNVVRSQAQIRTYMNTSLPNPTTQAGLLAYYTFDDLLNKQGNPAWNGTLGGSASINATNTACNFFTDSCSNLTNISNIINTYTPVLALNPCENKITVEDAGTFNTGDTVLMIQMKGATIDTTNTAAFGTITNYNNAGNYEYNYVKSKAGNVIELKNVLVRQYTIPAGRVQLIRVPYYNSAKIIGTLTCPPWDGSKGGVLVMNVKDTLEMQGDIDVKGKGFRGGVMHNSMINTFVCAVNDYHYPINTIHAAGKGESIAEVDSLHNAGRGNNASGGGGGMNPNTGGGGGGNGGTGGRGGYGYNLCPTNLTDNNWGLGGNPLAYNSTVNKIFMGGGGGAGHCNNGFSNPSVNTDFNGGNGGGLVIINTQFINGNNKLITASGDTAYELTAPGFLAHDGMGGGGAGGTISINSTNYLSLLNAKLLGGKGGNMSSSTTGGLVGPGGGGAGGVLWVSQASLPGSLTVNNNGGTGGVIIQDGNNPYGATAGLNGTNAFNLQLIFSTVPFQKNIDSVRIKDSLTSCNGFDFKGLAYTNTNPISTWQWYFGDGGTANTQNTSHTYSASGNYTVKLVVNDNNGCSDSISTNIFISCLTPIGNVINDYTPVIALNPCENKITVEDASAFNVGDTVLMIQMKGAIIDSTNTLTFGTITNLRNAGNYEFNYVKTKTGNIIELRNTLTRQYDIPVGKVQLVRVPYYQNATINSMLTCLPWDGNKGGILVLNAQDSVILNATIDVSGKGFRGGADPYSNPPVLIATKTSLLPGQPRPGI